ncbi:amidohydrolase 2 [Penicillium angulare]|uniref:Amidohydrolase 2 n=1 Tax=Penicillium angulare TaxID=116970 RepID=A0A9W9JZV8_9EURO|nr:amidohydrolase 2 [Penicillium angulare]
MASQTITINGNNPNIQPFLLRKAFDTHVHVFDPRLGPYATGRAYTPEDAPLESLIAFNQRLSKDPNENTIILVQPSPYKNDCSVMLQCLRKLKTQNVNAFGIAVLNLDVTTDAELKGMHGLGVRGIRLNLQADGKEVSVENLVSALQRTADRIRYLPGWIIQLFVPGWSWDCLHDTIRDLPVRVIADHLGGMLGPSKLPSTLQLNPTSQPGFKSLLSLAKQGRIFVKISGLYRMSNEMSMNFSDLQSIVQSFATEIPDQIIWGSDWPHTGDGHSRLNKSLEMKEPFRIINNSGILEQLREWMGDDVYSKMLVENPIGLYQN